VVDAAQSVEVGPELRELLRGIPLFATLRADELDEVLSRCRTEFVGAGDWCVRAGDPADALYVVVYGRLQTYVDEEPGNAISRGHVFGEIGMITREPRLASIRAVRDTQLLVIPADEFDRLADEQSGWLRRAAQVVTERLGSPSRRPLLEHVLTLGVFTLGEGRGAVDQMAELAAELGRHAPTALVGAADAPPPVGRASWAHQLEGGHRYVLYEGSSGDRAWGEWCLRNCDRVVIVADADASVEQLPPAVTRELPARRLDGNLFILLVQRARAERPRLSAGWLDAAGDGPVLHLRRSVASDVGRAARLVTGRGCGLVLGGGGPRGWAHLGVMQALDEIGLPVDMVGGTSIGAAMGSCLALDLDSATRLEWATSGFVDSGNLFPPTLPVLSYTSARKVRELLEDPSHLGDRAIEETWLPFFCVSANLTRAKVVVHDRGSLATAVRASLSIPGIFPPVRHGSDFLVDGGVLNNLPVDIMRSRPGIRWVVAVDLSVDEEVRAAPSYKETPSGWRLLADRLTRRRDTNAPPLSLNVLMRAMELPGIEGQRRLLADYPPDVLIRPDVSGAGMFDFQSARNLVEVGYREAMSHLEELQSVVHSD
jgi:predicted acylesterase/phospholipase RssA/CRP-like cAMP-binding protein